MNDPTRDATPATAPANPGALTLDRRCFLRSSGGAVLGAWAAAHGWAIEPAAAAPPGPGGPTPGGTFSRVLRRREDFLRLHFEFHNLRVVKGSPPKLVRRESNAAAYVVVTFPPQAVAEEALFEHDADMQDKVAPPPGQNGPEPQGNTPLPSPPTPVGARLADASRLAFLIPPAVTAIPYTAAGLLAWDQWSLQVVPVAKPERATVGPSDIVPLLRPPGALETAIELPWWLLISPHSQARWAHAAAAVTTGGRTELWHTRLAGSHEGATSEAVARSVRGVWVRDPGFADYLDEGGKGPNQPVDGEDFPQPSGRGMPFRTSLSPRDRFDIVTSSADFAHATTKPGYVPAAVDVDRVMLSSLGGWLDVDGTWEDAGVGFGQSGTSLEAWRHRATLGRDHYVRIVRRGFFYPVKHAAALLKITERKFRTAGRGQTRTIAYLVQRYLLVPRQREVVYGGFFDTLLQGRASPFVRVRITTSITPNLDPPEGIDPPPPGEPFDDAMAFVPTVGNVPVRFAMLAEDHAGRTHAFTSALAFVDAEIAADTDAMDQLRAWYEALDAAGEVRAVHLNGARVAAADPGEELGSTDLEIRRFSWGAGIPTVGPHHAATPATTQQLAAAGEPAFLPTMAAAEVRLAAADAIVGAGLPSPIVVYREDYTEQGFVDAAPGEVFAKLTAPVNLEFGGTAAGGDRAGAVATPSFAITALSRHAGAFGGEPDEFQSGTFEPAQVFAALDATLLGDIALTDVIASGIPATDPGGVLRLVTRDTTDAVVTEMRWKPPLQAYPLNAAAPLFVPSLHQQAAVLELTATITTPKAAPQAATVSVVGDLRRFQIALLDGAPMVNLAFDRLRFVSESGKKTDVDAEISAVDFLGALMFVQELQQYLSFDAGGFAIAVEPTHVTASLELPLPNLAIGVFALQNLAFAASATLPFTGEPVRFRFGFCTLDNPFLLTVMIFGGGGFFALALGPDGVDEFQMSLEFGAAAALDLGVAAGSVSITAGIYLAIGKNTPNNPDGAAELTGFLKLAGEVEVLGVLTISLLMKASMTYIDTGKAVVRAVVVVEVEVLLVSTSVEIEYEKTFGGGNADPTFGDTMTAADWSAYAAAFAPIGA